MPKATSQGQRYETLKAASERTGVSVRTIRKRIAAGELCAYRLGRIIRIKPEDLDSLFTPTRTGEVGSVA